MRHLLWILGLIAACAAAGGIARADEIVLMVEGAPSDGLVMAAVDLTAAARWCKSGPIDPNGLRAVAEDGREIPFQLLPDADYQATDRVAGTALVKLPAGGSARLRIEAGKPKPMPEWDGTVRMPGWAVVHDPQRSGGLPCRISFAGGPAIEGLVWQDRAYSAEKKAYRLADDRDARVERIAAGPLATVVRVRARYVTAAGEQAPSQPEAIYDWCYLHDRPLVYVSATQRQREPIDWQEMHFFELHPGETFTRWAGGEPFQEGEFSGNEKSNSFGGWAAVSDGRNTIGLLESGRMMVYDGRGKGYDSYLHAHADAAWTGMSGAERRLSAWLWLASEEEPWKAAPRALGMLPRDGRLIVTVDRVAQRIEQARTETERLPAADRQARWRLVAVAGQLQSQGRFEEALRAAEGELPAHWSSLSAGELGMILEKTSDGLRLLQLLDARGGTQLLASRVLPLFAVTVRNLDTKQETVLTADAGWQAVEAISADGAQPSLQLRWQRPKDGRLGSLSITATAEAAAAAPAIEWTLKVADVPAPWCVRNVVFPQVAVGELGPDARVLFPRCAGEVQSGVWRRPFRFSGTYPSGWTSMMFAAAYGSGDQPGLYVATHDPWGSTKEVVVESRPQERAVVMAFDHPAPEIDRPGNGFEFSGKAVWQLFRGDWFDAAVIYRDWVRREAKWYPRLGPEGREDTPPWMRELPVWAMTGGAPADVVPAVKKFAEKLGVPVGFHWYSWHQIPFDNDYPHYFPTKDGFPEAVEELQRSGVHVMPYINGRLWDTRDKGLDDFQFTSVAKPAVTKDEEGQPYTEMYGSKESDGSRVALGVMCPATDVWQDKVKEIVLRLMNECGVHGVYIDQVAAAKAMLCFDRSHGHPTGGGHWWTEAYWQMLDDIHREMAPDRMLTTECNAEPYIHVFDGYLTWHWQYDGQVPAFPAVYGGAVQMFGRAYRGGPTKALALRMKAAQQLVWGEQIGWIHPQVVDEPESAEFFREVVRLRWNQRRFFHAGEMARPPRLAGEIPRVTADWQWSGEWPVTTDAVMAGAWRLTTENRLVMLWANVGDEPVTATLHFDAGDYGLPGEKFVAVRITADGESDRISLPRKVERELTFPPRSAWGWVVSAE